MGASEHGDDFEELQRILRDMLSGQGVPEGGMDAEQFAKAAGIPGIPRPCRACSPRSRARCSGRATASTGR